MKHYILSTLLLTITALSFVACNDDNSFTDPRDGQKYKTVTIGNQIWMAENLNYETEFSWCYELKEDNCKKYGRLYVWDVALNACPDGWHLPSKDEFDTLITVVGGTEVAGKMLKSKTDWISKEKSNSNGVDQYGFSAKPSGFGYVTSLNSWDYINEWTYYWSSEESGLWQAYHVLLKNDEDYVSRSSDNKNFANSIRCIKGDAGKKIGKKAEVEIKAHSDGEMTDPRDGQKYRLVTIGNQVWIAENMNYKTENSRCSFYDEKKCKKYGRTYTYKDALDVCPNGWHLPSNKEFSTLIQTVGGKDVAGKALKSRVDWPEKTKRTDEYGFSALPINGDYDGDECGYNFYAIFWSSSENSDGSPYGLFICNDWNPANIAWVYEKYHLGVRCIMD